MLLLSMTIMAFSALAYQSQLKGRQTLAVAYASQSTVKATLVFSTYIGGTAWENLRGIATDPQGYIYITGGTNSADYPTTMGPPHQGPDHTLWPKGGCLQSRNGSWPCCEIFVTKLTPDGKNIVWSRLIGTTGHDRAYGVKWDPTGYLLIWGRMGMGYKMTPGVFQPTFGGHDDNRRSGYGYQNGFIGKLNPSDGSIYWISYCGSEMLVRNADVDEVGNVYAVTGYKGNHSPWAPHTARCPWHTAFRNAYQKTPPGGLFDSVVMKIKSDGTQVLWASYFGGTDWDEPPQSIGIHTSTREVYICGQTKSKDLPGTSNVFTRGRKFNGGNWDFFVAKFSSDGSVLRWAAYLGGSSDEFLNTQNLIIEQSTGNVYVFPWTGSTDYPVTTGSFQSKFQGGNGDAAISKISSDGTTLMASTYLGGSSNDNGDGIVLDNMGNVYVSGETQSSNFPVTSGAFQSNLVSGSKSAFATIISSDLSHIIYSTYLGGSIPPGCQTGSRATAIDPWNNLIIGGCSNCDNLPTRNAIQPSRAGHFDATIAKFWFSK